MSSMNDTFSSRGTSATSLNLLGGTYMDGQGASVGAMVPSQAVAQNFSASAAGMALQAQLAAGRG